MNIIIVGCGKIGQKLAQQLNYEEDLNITVVDIRYNVVQDIINQYDIMGVVGSGTSIETLTEAGIETADILIAVTGSDELNLLTCLIAKKTGNCQTIARVRKPEYSKEINLIKKDLGLTLVINPEQTAAAEIARSLRLPSAIKIDSFAKGRVELLKLKIPENSVLDNLTVMDIAPKLNCDILLCGVERNESAFIPRGNFVLKSGDRISVIASPKNAAFFFKKTGIKTNRVKDTIIVGGGTTAVYLAKYLLQSGISVKIIERDTERCETLCRLLPKASIVNADGTENRVLLEEGIEYAESFVALTNIDEENVLLSLFAKSKSNAKLVTKINRIAYDEVISSLELDTIVYPKNITAEYIIKFVRAKKNSIGSNVETMHLILDGKAEALEFNIRENSPVSGIPLESLSLKENILIACINRNGNIITPRGKDIIKCGDTVIVVTTITGLKDISDILEQRKK
ncbi:MAG: Trk system potassium transporter TrkA [Clostridia bacterium]|nr:Trk system potassium transporter TrkA [Clostridia bacterium]